MIRAKSKVAQTASMPRSPALKFLTGMGVLVAGLYISTSLAHAADTASISQVSSSSQTASTSEDAGSSQTNRSVCPIEPDANLSSANVYAGTPSPDNSNMIPPDDTSDTSSAPSIYSLLPEYPRPIIVACSYDKPSHNINVTLPDSVNSCEFLFKAGDVPSMPQLTGVICNGLPTQKTVKPTVRTPS